MMVRKISAFCLSIVAVLGLAAVWTASASALGEKFHSATKPTVLTGSNYEIDGFGTEKITEGEHSFTAGMFSVKCTTSTVSGTLTIETPEFMTLHPTYSGCKDNIGNVVTIDTTGCNLNYWSEVLGGSDAKVEVECEAGQLIKITDGGCTLKIGAQSNLGATYANKEDANKIRDITFKSTFEAGFTKEGFCVGVEGTKGKYLGNWTVGGYEDKCAAGECPFAPGGKGDKDGYNEGNKVSIWWE